MAYGDIYDPNDPLEVEVVPVPRGHPILAWLLIIATIVGIPILRALYPRQEPGETRDRLGQMVMTLQAKYLIGMLEAFGRQQQPAVLAQIEALNVGSIEQRFRYVVLIGEFSTARAAEQQLRSLETRVTNAGKRFTQQEQQVKDILERLYSDYADGQYQAPSVKPAERETLKTELGWFGDLALAPQGAGLDNPARTQVIISAKTTFFTMIVAIVVALLFGIVGFVGLILYLVFMVTGKLGQGLELGSPNGGVYAETFALWMILFILLTIIVAFIPAGENSLLLAGAASLGSVGALIWPVLRGIPWRQVRQDIGLYAGDNPLVEPPIGVYGYVMGIPLLAIGVMIMFMLMFIVAGVQSAMSGGKPGDEFGPAGYPAHPIVEYLAGSGWWPKLQVLIIGSLIAPFVEEIMFRGVLHRHMREATGRWGFFLSLVVSGTVVSFVFAVIHPQGLLAVPALMALAYAFTLLREWRGSLVSCMVAHGLNNFLVMSLAMALFSS